MLYLTNAQHEQFDKALTTFAENKPRGCFELDEAAQAIADGMPEDLYTVDMMDAYAALGRIIGEDVDEDLVNEIFEKFCMGK